MPEPATTAAVEVVDYDPEWPEMFQKLKDRIWPFLCDAAVAIEHVGSTSVIGMAAKPVIDADIVIASTADLPVLIVRLENLGYKHRGNLGIDGRDAFATPKDQPAHHLYVCIQNSLALRNHIAVRDYLRTHRSQAMAYSDLKKQLAKQFASERLRYQEGKTDFILSILEQCGFSTDEMESIRRANQM